ncbi:MAG: tRNA (adenosine(37)-N6)-threonylcarbamoyltransferase complex ATPase subunit type 1 TsaE, partial [Patescibacteria group bacterium]
MQKEYLTKSSGQTKKLGKSLAQALLRSRSKNKAIVIGLRGDLGGGKTTFLQGFAKGLGKKARILSPTFIIMRRTDNFYHIDCYRIQGFKDLLTLGLKKMLTDPKNIVAIEWADRVKKNLPRHTVWVDFYFVDKNKRR